MTAICRPAPVGPPQGSEAKPLPEARDAALFDAELRPNRSLSPRGFLILMGAVCAISFTGGLAFFLAGAWPVIGFLGADVLLIFLAFRINYRRGRLVERLHLTPEALTVKRIWPGGQARSWEFQPYWLQVDLADPPRHDSPLVLRSHGRSLSIGSFLTKEERAEVATALRTALVRARQSCRPA
ncbi:DUF2244 domain-containing protein [Pelagibius sp.]|uniref:DUF2244 domain-containing protein n=1 Tax=Pelagibius sp. TaxID=1931238 RepID=UPI003BB04AAF